MSKTIKATRAVILCGGDMRCFPDDSNCPNNLNHEPTPRGYGDQIEWWEQKRKTHAQSKCPECHRWAIWTPKGGPR